MYAIFEDGGRQYKVSEGDALLVDVREMPEESSEITFDRVLMLGAGADAKIGTPWIDGATVQAKVVQDLKMPKVHGVKFKRRKGYLKRWGHRQRMLRVEITKINS